MYLDQSKSKSAAHLNSRYSKETHGHNIAIPTNFQIFTIYNQNTALFPFKNNDALHFTSLLKSLSQTQQQLINHILTFIFINKFNQ